MIRSDYLQTKHGFLFPVDKNTNSFFLLKRTLDKITFHIVNNKKKLQAIKTVQPSNNLKNLYLRVKLCVYCETRMYLYKK